MTASPQSEPRERIKQDLPDKREALIGEQVLHVLGEPRDLLRVQVRKLWPGRYRVNVLLGVDVASARVAHSYFLAADGDGNITSSVPQIVKHY
jgi:hypothetical protein